jgi:hypothetical protein
MSNILYLIFFGIFVGIVVVLRFTRSVVGRRRMITILVLYVVLLHGVLAVTRRDAWPFATHGLFFEKSDERRPFSNVRFVAVDRSGQEHQIDPKSWSPIHDRTLEVWWLVEFERLNPEERRQAMAFLLERAERARRSGPSRLTSFLGAPHWYSIELPALPSNAPYVGFRAYLVTRAPIQKFTSGSESRQLIAEFRR